MSCAIALAAALAMADAYAAPPPTPPTVSALSAEPLYADIVHRARAMQAQIRALEQSPGLKAAQTPTGGDALVKLRPDLLALSALDLKGHFDLEARHGDGDLKCILKGVSEDLPRKFDQALKAPTGAAESAALDELAYLLDDNAGVILAPPRPPA
jgi:hypothetical protein